MFGSVCSLLFDAAVYGAVNRSVLCVTASLEELVLHGCKAIRESAADHDVNCKNLSIAIVHGDGNYVQLVSLRRLIIQSECCVMQDDEAAQPYVDLLKASEDAPAAAAEAPAADMEVEQ